MECIINTDNTDNIDISNEPKISQDLKLEKNISLDNDIILEQTELIEPDDKNVIEDDPWESSINDNKFYINNRIARIFPVIKNYSSYGKIKIDDDSFSYITIREVADFISKIISHHLLKYNINSLKTSIIDYTAGVGGNVLSFSKYFKKVFGIELSKIRSEYLENNVQVYGFKNIQVFNESSLDFNENKLSEINPSVVFVDPPWGGVDYKNSDSLLLKLGDMSIEELIISITSKFSVLYKNKFSHIEDIETRKKYEYSNYNNKFIVLKLPKNYDIEYFYNYIKNNFSFENFIPKIYLYILNKMLIVIVEL